MATSTRDAAASREQGVITEVCKRLICCRHLATAAVICLLLWPCHSVRLPPRHNENSNVIPRTTNNVGQPSGAQQTLLPQIAHRTFVPEAKLKPYNEYPSRDKFAMDLKRHILKSVQSKVNLAANNRISRPTFESARGRTLRRASSRDTAFREGRDTKRVLVPLATAESCLSKISGRMATCLHFDLSRYAVGNSIKGAQLWIGPLSVVHSYSVRITDTDSLESLVAGDASDNQNISSGILVKLKRIPMRSWLSANITELLANWDFHADSTRPGSQGTIRLAIEGLQGPAPGNFLLVLDEKRPTRRRRNSNCNSLGCCVEELNVSFAQIGLDDIILEPRSYTTKFCTGVCYEGYFAWILKQFSLTVDKTYELCCMPDQMRSLSVVVKNGSNVREITLDRVIIDNCTCP